MTAISPPLPEVIAVEPVLDRWLRLTFTAGDPASPVVRQYDVDPWLSKGMFRALRDPLLFRQAFIQHGTVCWPGNLDIEPECLWEKSLPWVEPGPCEGVLPTGMARAGGPPNAVLLETSLSPKEALALRAAREWRLDQQQELRQLRGCLQDRASGPQIPLLSTVVALVPVPKGTIGVSVDLPRGTLGTVVEHLAETIGWVEFADENGVSVAETPMLYVDLLTVSRASQGAAGISVTALKGMAQRPATPVAVEDMNAAGLNARAAVAVMLAFVEEGQALHHEATATGDTEAASHQLTAALLQAISHTELSRASVHKVLLEVAEQAGEPAIGHVTPVDGNVFADLGFPPEEVARLKAESDTKIDVALAARATEASKCDHLYEADPVAWAEFQARLLQAEAWENLDKGHLLEVLGRLADLFRAMASVGTGIPEASGSNAGPAPTPSEPSFDRSRQG